MGIGKKVVKHKTKGAVEDVTSGIPVVGGIVDKNVKSGPMDRVGDSMDKSKDKLSGATDKLPGGKKEKEKKIKKPGNPLKRD